MKWNFCLTIKYVIEMRALSKLNISQSNILSKDELKQIKGRGIICRIMITDDQDPDDGEVMTSGPCAMSSAEECTRVCNATYNNTGFSCECG